MADNYLLVPMHLDAMVLNRMDASTTPFLRFQMDYSRLSEFRSPEPEPFEGASTRQPNPGIYLHWTLPKALRQGMHKVDRGTEFPLVPNRWVIVRTLHEDETEQAVKAWILESDHLSELGEGATGTSPFLDPTVTYEGSLPQPKLIGRALRLTPDLQSLESQDKPFLKAVAPGNAVFSVFSPGGENVFSFYDDVTANDDQTLIEKGTITYHVAGWYSDSNHDPINNSSLEWVVNSNQASETAYRLQWKPGTDPTIAQHPFDWFVYADHADLPKQMLVHALIYKVGWDRMAENPLPTDFPTDIQNRVKVAIGNTAIDALSAIVRLDENSQIEADMLEVLQYNALETFDQPGAAEAQNMTIREHWFGTSPGGTRWTIVAEERTASSTSHAPVLTGPQKIALAELNALQSELDRQRRVLQSMQWELYALWWKENWMIVHQDTGSYFDDSNGSILKWLSTQLASHTGNPWIFRAGDFLDPDEFCGKLKAAADAQSTDNVYAYLQSLFTPDTQNLLAEYTSPASTELQAALIDEHNSLLKFPALYQQAAFDQVTLRPESLKLLNQNPQQGIELMRLNRLLLEDAYQSELLKSNLRQVCNHSTGTDQTQESWFICKVKAQQNLVAQLTDRTQTALGGLQELLDSSGQRLKHLSEPQYYGANDPVVLITGLGRSTNFDPVDKLMCRLPSQTISGGSAEMPALSDPYNLMPDAVQQLHRESFFLKSGTQPQAGRAPVSFAMEDWAQPWVPLLLDWEVTVLKEPAYSSPQSSEDGSLHTECVFNLENNWQFDGTDYVWIGARDAGGPDNNFDQTESQMTLSGRTFVTPQLSFTLADQLEEYVQKHKMRDPNLEALMEKLETYLETFKSQDILSQRLSGLRAMMVERSYRATVAPFGDIKSTIGDYGHGHPMPYLNPHYTQDAAVWDFAPMAGTFFVINKLMVIDSFGRTVDLMLANNSANPQTEETDRHSYTYFYPIVGRDMKAPQAKDPFKGLGESNNATERMIQLTPRLSQDAQLSFRLLTNDGQDRDIYQAADANPICGWVVPNHLNRSLALYAPDGTAWGELYLSLQGQNRFLPAWQADPTDLTAPQSWDEIPNPYIKEMVRQLCGRTDDGAGFYDFLQVIDETLWTINPRGRRHDQNLSVLIGRPLALVRAQLSMKLRGLPYYNQDWWNTFDINFDPSALPDDGSLPHSPGTFDGGISNYLWQVRLGSHVLRNDGLIGYYVDDPNTAGDTFKVFNTVNLPASVRTHYLNQIGQSNYLTLRFIDDSVIAPDATRKEVCNITMLVDPRASIHAFTGLLPPLALDVPAEFVKPALRRMSYMFRAGPFLTSPEEVRIPQPAEKQGTWSWFDNVTKSTIEFSPTDDNARMPVTPPLVKEGWLKFRPDPSPSSDVD